MQTKALEFEQYDQLQDDAAIPLSTVTSRFDAQCVKKKWPRKN